MTLASDAFVVTWKANPVKTKLGAGSPETRKSELMVIDDMGPDQYRVTRTTPDGKSDSYGLIDLDEEPAHDVRITKGFWIGQTPVTVEVYQQCARDTGAAVCR